jgi:group I intron endonuclease
LAPKRKYEKQPYEIGVYGILNTITSKWYIGSSIELSKRMGRHLWELRKGVHHSTKLQRSFDKHGESAFQFKILLVCEAKDAEMFETRAIKSYDSYLNGYNVAAEAKGGFMRGRKWPEGTKEARIEAMRGRTMSESNRANQSVRKKAEWADPATRVARARSMQKPKSPEGRAAIAAGHIKGQETRRRKRLEQELKIKETFVSHENTEIKES